MLSYFGRCPRCMRTAFFLMLGSWAVAATAAVVTDQSPAHVAAGIAAVGATILWLAHVTAFSLRAVAREASTGRRRTLIFVGAASFAISATSLPAFAQKCPCRQNYKCCFNYDAKRHVCAPRNAVCCTHATSPWYCSGKQTCNGDGSTLPKCR